MRRPWSIWRLAGICLIAGSFYLGWAWYRWDLWRIAHDTAWPRGFPYPDRMLMALERRFDEARPGYIKMHGEYSLVQKSVATAAVVLGAGGVLLLLPLLLDRMQWKGSRGFPVRVDG